MNYPTGEKILKNFLGFNSHGRHDKIPWEKQTPAGFSKIPRDFSPFTMNCAKVLRYI